MSALDELLKDIPQDYDEVDVANHLLHWREPAAAELAALKARVKQAEENWHKNELRASHMNSALATCVMFLANVNTITEEKQVELIKSLRMAGLVDLADSVAAGGFASVFEGAE